jgi:prepilin peptidase CpaA
LNLIAAAPSWLVVVLGCALVAAATEDALRLRISNVTSLVVFAAAIVAMIIEGASWSLWQNAVAFAAILTLGTFAFSAGWMGGGDVKLLAATALWFDLKSAVWLLALVLLAGGLLAVCYLLSRPFRGVKGTKKGSRVPYGIAIAVGALAMGYMVRPSFHHHPLPLLPSNIVPPRG